MASYVIVGRSPDCNLVVNHPSVSGRHARLSWKNGLVLVEDLGSANGVYVDRKKVASASVRPGDEVLLGEAALPWTREELKAFLRLGGSGTALAKPPPPKAVAPKRSAKRIVASVLTGVITAASVGVIVAALFPGGREKIRQSHERVQAVVSDLRPSGSDHEAYIRARLAPRLREAIDPADPVTRNAAVQIAARQQGAFRVEQVAAIWGHVRERWRYVNDPQGTEYFARARETIANNYAGDCDDFAIALAAMLGAIGGESRVVFSDGSRGGHAYAEVCIREDAATVASKLARFYARSWSRYTTRGRPRQIAFRRTDDCPVWLNLDWFATVPGGEYANEQWAVAIYPNGRTETLAAAVGVGDAGVGPQNASRPRTLATPPGE